MTPDRGAGGPQPRSELLARVLSGLVMAAAALLATWAGGLVFAAFWLAAAIAVLAEWIYMTRAEPRILLLTLAGCGLAALVATLGLRLPGAVLAGAAALTMAALAVLGRDARSRVWAIAGFSYAAAVVVVPIVLRERSGALSILWLFAVVWGTDIAAYFVGRALGGAKLWPNVSPKKTWSGFLGGLIAASVAGTIVLVIGASPRATANPPWSLLLPLGAGAVASVASQAGDLAESAMKRRFGVKDSGTYIPGHGGAMDRLDGFAAVCFLLGAWLVADALSGTPGAPS